METLTVRRESLEETLDYDVLVSEFDDGSEQRRLKHGTPDSDFKVNGIKMTYVQMKSLRDFYVARKGAMEAFYFLNPNDQTTYTVRFVPKTFKTSYSSGMWQVEFEMKRV